MNNRKLGFFFFSKKMSTDGLLSGSGNNRGGGHENVSRLPSAKRKERRFFKEASRRKTKPKISLLTRTLGGVHTGIL